MTTVRERREPVGLRERGIADSSEEVVRATASVLRSLRSSFDSHKFLEVVTPVLQGARKTALVEPLEVKFPEQSVATRAGIARRAVDRAQLSAVPGGYLQALVPSVGNVYSIAPMFRGELVPSWLTEFRYVQATGPGSLDDAVKLAETIIGDAVKALDRDGIKISEKAKKFSGKVTQMPYAEAVKKVHGIVGEPLSHDQYRELANANQDKPVIVMGVPLHLEPYAALGARMRDGGPAFFEVVVPDAGEVGAGKEYETNVDEFWKHADGTTARRLGTPWHDTEDLEAVAELVGRFQSPTYSVGLGLERLTQYLLGKRNVGEATAFAVVNGGKLRIPILME